MTIPVIAGVLCAATTFALLVWLVRTTLNAATDWGDDDDALVDHYASSDPRHDAPAIDREED